jgi:hypothetical protein
VKRIKQAFKEPLFVFLLLGGAMFALFQQVSNDYQPDNAKIVVTERQIQSLLLGFEKVWQRSPSETEVDGLIQNYIREEILYREALAIGLDKDDGIVRRRLSQKMAFISEDLASLDKPEEQELQAFLVAHAEDYRQPSRFSFRHIYLNTSKRGESAQSDAIALLAKLKTQDSNATLLGDPLMVKRQFNLETERDIERVLGSQFLQSLNDIPTGSWQGPISSGFGLHLVRVDERIEGKVSQLNEVRDEVVRDLGSEKRDQTNKAFYQNIRKRYTVKVESHSRISTASESEAKLTLIQGN